MSALLTFLVATTIEKSERAAEMLGLLASIREPVQKGQGDSSILPSSQHLFFLSLVSNSAVFLTKAVL